VGQGLAVLYLDEVEILSI